MTGRRHSRGQFVSPAVVSETSKVVEAAREGLKVLREQTSEQAATLAASLRERGQTVVAEQRTRAAEEIQHLGKAVRRAAEKLHDQNSDALARYVDAAAESLEGVSEYVQEADL